MLVGLVQATLGENNAEYYIKNAKEKGCQILCFPEAFLTGYHPVQVKDLAVTVEDFRIKEISSLARKYEMDLLMGFMEKDLSGYYLSHGIFRMDGTMDVYRKTHLGEKEAEIFQAGNSLNVYTLSGGVKVGFQMCVETHFPDITQKLSLDGAEIIFAPFAVPGTPQKRKEVWSKIIPARSYDNRVYMACCNLYDGQRFGGGCMATDPTGKIVAEDFGNENELLVFTYEEEQVRRFHEGNASMKYRYYPSKRRAELFE